MGVTSIEWTDRSWNAVRGCSRISEGCRNCYAERVAARFSDRGELEDPGVWLRKPGPFNGFAARTTAGPRWTGRVELVPDKLREPLTWRKPVRVFVNSMSDLFHESLSDEAIAAVFGAMVLAPEHTYQILTKRADRLPRWMKWAHEQAEDLRASAGADPASGSAIPTYCALQYMEHQSGVTCLAREGYRISGATPWPLPNVWLGVSVEDQVSADERIPLLLQAPAAIRFVSAEPLLGPVDLGLQSATCSCCARWSSRWVRLKRRVSSSDVYLGYRPDMTVAGGTLTRADSNPHGALSVRTPGGLLGIKPAEFDCLPALDWVIVGGESGPGARPCDVAWVRSIVQQCKAAGVACFVKQLGAVVVGHGGGAGWPNGFSFPGKASAARLKDRKGGDPTEWPEDLRVREFPEPRP